MRYSPLESTKLNQTLSPLSPGLQGFSPSYFSLARFNHPQSQNFLVTHYSDWKIQKFL